MRPRLLPDGKLEVPVRIEHDGIIGDALEVIGPKHEDYAAWLTELPFVVPNLPSRFMLADPERPDSADGPFDADSWVIEPDNAIVFYEDGSLPMRLGVLQQAGTLLTLNDGSQIRVVPWDESDPTDAPSP